MKVFFISWKSTQATQRWIFRPSHLRVSGGDWHHSLLSIFIEKWIQRRNILTYVQASTNEEWRRKKHLLINYLVKNKRMHLQYKSSISLACKLGRFHLCKFTISVISHFKFSRLKDLICSKACVCYLISHSIAVPPNVWESYLHFPWPEVNFI